MEGAQQRMVQVAGWVEAAHRIAVLTGAGVSAESGVPTFRDAQTGHWAQFRPEEMASEAGFRTHPQRVWDWYQHRREMLRSVSPNAAHRALADFGRRRRERMTLITQNVDGLHQQAGSERVLCLHGDLFVDRWLDAPRGCCAFADTEAGHPPRCSGCGNLRRPGVVWFGEALPERPWAEAQQAVQTCDLMLVVGTAGAVYPAAGLAQRAREAGARVVVVNPAESALDDVAHRVLRGTAAQVMPLILSSAMGMAGSSPPPAGT